MSERIDANFSMSALDLVKVYQKERLNTQSEMSDTEVLASACEKLISLAPKDRFFKPSTANYGIHANVNDQFAYFQSKGAAESKISSDDFEELQKLMPSGSVNKFFAELKSDPEKILDEFNVIFGTKFTLKELKGIGRFGQSALLDGIQTFTWPDKGIGETNPLAKPFNTKGNPGMTLVGCLLVYMSLKNIGGINNEKYRKQWMLLANIIEGVNVYYGNTRYGSWSSNEICNPADPGKSDWTRTIPIIQIPFDTK